VFVGCQFFDLVSFIYCGFAFGAALGGLGSEWLIENFGWRSVLVAGGDIGRCGSRAGYAIDGDCQPMVTTNRGI